jgi:DNA mismatch repair protein MutS2
MDSHTLTVLEFDRLREIVSSLARSPLGAKLALSMTPSTDQVWIEKEMDRVTELSSVLDSGEFSLGPVHDIGELLERCSSQGFILTPEELYRVAQTARTARLARAYFGKDAEKHPLLSDLALKLSGFQDLEKDIFKSVGEDGEVLDSASEELGSIRGRREKLRGAIRQSLTSIMGNNEDLLQEKLITLRQERYVIPIKSEGKRRIQCIVHDISASGATLFVEPLSVLESNNELQENRREEQEEIKRIMARLSDRVREHAPGLGESLNILGELDLLHAKVSFAHEFKCVRPELDSRRGLTVKGGVHPLLFRRKGASGVVPLDLELGNGFNILLISGPNAGGKTVALKTIGILTLLSQCGMHIPAASGTRLSVFSGVYADIGDEQSIERDLSTFSSHVKNIIEILGAADSKSLVLLDEIGVGTDPRSGTGLAMAVLSQLARRDARTLATSHYGELKIFVEAARGMRNASVESDPETLQPTYKLKMGIPGSSNTFEIAERLGMDPELLSLAREFAREGSSRAEEIIASLERSLAKSERIAEEARIQKEELSKLSSEYEVRLARVRSEEKEAKTRRREQARRLLEGARSTVENLVREIRESQADRESIRRAKRTIERELLKHVEAEKPSVSSAEDLREGDTVYVEPFDATGKIVSVSKGSARVEVEKVRCEVPLSSVKRRAPAPDKPSPPVRTSTPEAEYELNIVGTTRDEGLQALDKHIDRAFMSGLSLVRIVHGKGRGVLKKAVENALSGDPRVESFREGSREEGGWGVTIAKIKT